MKNFVLLLGIVALLSACNTIEGIGDDVKGAGEWTAESAQKVKKKIDE
jgi:predicted small secreted protein